MSKTPAQKLQSEMLKEKRAARAFRKKAAAERMAAAEAKKDAETGSADIKRALERTQAAKAARAEAEANARSHPLQNSKLLSTQFEAKNSYFNRFKNFLNCVINKLCGTASSILDTAKNNPNTTSAICLASTILARAALSPNFACALVKFGPALALDGASLFAKANGYDRAGLALSIASLGSLVYPDSTCKLIGNTGSAAKPLLAKLAKIVTPIAAIGMAN